jgi:outer membrane immunogenic protein
MKLLKVSIAMMLALAATSASAADMPVKARPLAPAPVFSWSGFYVGGNVGYAWGTVNGGPPSIFDSIANPPVLFTTLNPYNFDVDGIVGGGQIGYNLQFGQTVLGIEADFQGTNLKGGGSSTTRMPGVAIDLDSKIDWFGTVRGRLGYAMDRVLIYGTGGLAYGKLQTTLGLTEAGVLYSRTDQATHVGWTAGAGIEAAFAAGWSAKIEYLHVDLGSEKFSFQYPGIRVDIDKDYSFDLVRIGLNYRFGAR